MLGFGFDKINMKRLALDDAGPLIYATCQGRTALEQQDALRFTQNRLLLHDLNSLELLRNVFPLE